MGAYDGALGGVISTSGDRVRHFGDWGASTRPGRGPQAHVLQASQPPNFERKPNLVIIASPNQMRPLRAVHLRLRELHPEVLACSRLIEESVCTDESLRLLGEGPYNEIEIGPDFALDRFILDAARTAKAALVVNIEPDADHINADPLSGGIRPEEFEGQIAPIEASGVPVLYMQPIPEQSTFAFHTMPDSVGMPPNNVVNACWPAIASLAVHGLN